MKIIPTLAAVLLLVGCSTAVADTAPKHFGPTKDTTQHQQHRLEPLTVAVVGDSITSWDPPYRYDPGQSWVTSAGLPTVGGWASPGATLGRMQENVVTTDAYYLILMGGTNDLFAGVSPTDRFTAIDSIIATVNPEQVVICAVAPYGFDYNAGVVWNEQLQKYAHLHGYHWVDPWAQVRDDAGAWLPGTSLPDHVHPTPDTAALVGVTIRDSITGLWS